MGWGNNRAVSEVLGAMLLFGIIVLALGSYQAFVVPQQNAQIESNHDAQVSNEFVEIQPAISNAAASGRTRTTSVTLGTRYPVRAAAVNPPTVSGQLGTGVSGDLEVTHDRNRIDACALTDTRPNTTSIRYKANYNELDNTGAFVYENGVTYRETDGGILQRTDQQVVDGSTIRLFPLVTEQFSTGSSGSEQLRFIPGETGIKTVDVDGGEKLNITFPSRLGEDEWNEIFGDADDFDGADDSPSGDTVTVTLSPSEDTTYTVRCTPVGVGSAPEQGTVPQEQEDTADPNPSGEINPASTVKLEGQSLDKKKLELTFKAVDESVHFSEARFSFYSAGPGSGSTSEITEISSNGEGSLDENLGVGEGYGDLIPSIEIEQGGTTITITFDKKVNQKNLLGVSFIIEENGERAQYIIGFS